jgi:hypothetical protein
VEEGKHEREGLGRGGRQRRPQGRDGSEQHGRKQQHALEVEAGWRTREGGGVRERGATRLTGGAGRQRGPVVSTGCGRKREKRQHGGGALTGGPGPHSTRVWFKLGF